MNLYLAFFISVLIWSAEFYSFAKYVATQSTLWMTISMIFIMLSVMLMWVGLGLIGKDDFVKKINK